MRVTPHANVEPGAYAGAAASSALGRRIAGVVVAEARKTPCSACGDRESARKEAPREGFPAAI
ncbi:hypothetical protein DR62_08105 [Burkholderia thailandensis]|nr:hypothetical protein DR62_08105 [Burkholderia thailandensis]AOI53912.1 hypothetical protein WI24_18545 [Burkholderia thailandensis]AOJ52894.1 hypothetical protein AQ475_18365 [Burkholderia thailandensis]AOJ58848.1 hypothetical protein AQ477_19730 [Burkholderia thailandensis]AVR28990.1 hypothetical protein A8H32_29960 [Burkholderia thailandensis]